MAKHAKRGKGGGLTFPPGRSVSSLSSMVTVNVQPSGKGESFASEYAVLIIAARNESSNACLSIPAFAILAINTSPLWIGWTEGRWQGVGVRRIDVSGGDFRKTAYVPYEFLKGRVEGT